MTLSSWLLSGALLQGVAWSLLGPKSLIPPTVILLYRVIDHLLMAAHITRNRYMDHTLQTKFSAQYPTTPSTSTTSKTTTTSTTTSNPPPLSKYFPATPAAQPLVVFHLGARVNHPLGMFAPGWKELGAYNQRMLTSMTADAEKYGLLGVSHWTKDSAAAGNESMSMFYLRDYDALHRFAHDPVHMAGVRWWADVVKAHPHIAIYHETYLVNRGQWENIYINSQPTGLADAWFPVSVEEQTGKGQRMWVRAPVDARGGALRSASRRLQRGWLEEVEKVEGELYDRSFAA
ncbi:monooxygenase fmaE [Aspergillus aculeatinus CBS 121060]|uniref:Uncharacterized protein n=1 Tax=Aspergillus aculeatinus CBS 121060 TaxID=1448322 RepID=A0ACD1HA75_9EURO|nr:hypothetical protein BO66DRAFT_391684 [Aspergillus aculeatinus CBS 121060]RAH70530.1 hypothetical protein BO66DRAFT_391684 [Aspergillus aculeatinus CBS 121060]